MTKREIFDRLRAADNGHGNGYDIDALHGLRDALHADVRAEETPRHAEDDGAETVATFDDARRRVQAIRDRVDQAGIKDTVLAVMLRVLCADLIDAADAEMRPDADDDREEAGAPQCPAVVLVLPPNYQVVTLPGEVKIQASKRD